MERWRPKDVERISGSAGRILRIIQGHPANCEAETQADKEVATASLSPRGFNARTSNPGASGNK